MKSCRATGSSIATGSSSTSSRGRRASARVSATCACWPPDSFPVFRFGGMPSSASRASRVCLVEAPVQVAGQVDHVRDRQVLVQRRVLGDERDPVQRGRRPGRPAAEHRDRCPRTVPPGRPPGSAAWSCRRRSGRPAPSRARRGPPACTRAAPRSLRYRLPRPLASRRSCDVPPSTPHGRAVCPVTPGIRRGPSHGHHARRQVGCDEVAAGRRGERPGRARRLRTPRGGLCDARVMSGGASWTHAGASGRGSGRTGGRHRRRPS